MEAATGCEGQPSLSVGKSGRVDTRHLDVGYTSRAVT